MLSNLERIAVTNDLFFLSFSVIQAYKNMREPGVTIVNGNGSFPKTVHLLYDTVKPLLN